MLADTVAKFSFKYNRSVDVDYNSLTSLPNDILKMAVLDRGGGGV